jgi:hypothetical protein
MTPPGFTVSGRNVTKREVVASHFLRFYNSTACAFYSTACAFNSTVCMVNSTACALKSSACVLNSTACAFNPTASAFNSTACGFFLAPFLILSRVCIYLHAF